MAWGFRDLEVSVFFGVRGFQVMDGRRLHHSLYPEDWENSSVDFLGTVTTVPKP